eukprot:CAMPEP_0116933200 /NCGR_PEP_ID=MMETSP0467-20121206/28892_1 /TAXON_ID=283647 /ORGANISM="Mesodinium pulex, Strain SPMC105" /LENGTH=49 /DNA_ID=CAMNT_0004614029 /DNA_START=601 /DNA_END=750 /DNA_ORIENTATION=+
MAAWNNVKLMPTKVLLMDLFEESILQHKTFTIQPMSLSLIMHMADLNMM